MKKLRLRDDPETNSIIMKRTKMVTSLELERLEERDPYPIQAKREFRIPPRSVMPVSFSNNLSSNLLFCTEINKELGELEELTIVPGIVDNETAELLYINFTNSVRKISPGTELGTAILTLPPKVPDEASILSTTQMQKPKKESIWELSNQLNNVDFPAQKERILQLLSKCQKAIALLGEQLGKTDLIEHQIILNELPQNAPKRTVHHTVYKNL